MTYKETLDYLFAQLPMFHRIGAAAYKADAIKKGNHTATSAEAVISRVKNGACSTAVAGTRTKRKPTAAKPRTKRK